MIKIHDLEYLLLRTIRRFKGSVIKSYQKGLISNEKFFRILAIFVLSISVLKVNFGIDDKRPAPPNYFGTVLSAQAPLPTPQPKADPPLAETPYPKRLSGSPDLDPILAKAVLVLDASSSAILYEKDVELKLPPASITKIMTALVSIESFSLAEEIVVPEVCTQFDGGSKMGLKIGEKISVENLLYGLLVSSAADSACSLSLSHGLTREQFVEKMNEKAKALGMTDTFYSNASGLDEANGGNVSTARDTLKLTIEALKNPFFRKVVSTMKITVNSADNSLIHPLINTNELLGTVKGISGVKTGFTDKAGGCLVFFYSYEGKEIVGVVLGSSERGRFEDVKKIIDWVSRVYTW